MLTSAPGNSLLGRLLGRRLGRRAGRNGPVHRCSGFTLLELLLVLAVIAVGVSLIVLTLPDGDAARLDEEGARLAALLETARAESRTSGVGAIWIAAADPQGRTQDAPQDFQFVGLPKALGLPSRWLDARVSAQVVGASAVVLGPEAILPAQRIVLSLGERRLELASDGLGPFAVAEPPAAAEPRR